MSGADKWRICGLCMHASQVVVWLDLRAPGDGRAFELAEQLASVGNDASVKPEIAAEKVFGVVVAAPDALERLNELFDREYLCSADVCRRSAQAPGPLQSVRSWRSVFLT
jgi:hypothetical protein